MCKHARRLARTKKQSMTCVLRVTSLPTGSWAAEFGWAGCNPCFSRASYDRASVLRIFGSGNSRGRWNVPKGYFGTRSPTEWQGVKTSPGGHSRHIPIESEMPSEGVCPFLMRVSVRHIPDSKTSSRPLRLSRHGFFSAASHERWSRENVYYLFNNY